MTRSLKNFCAFLSRCTQLAFDGDWRYYAWTGALFALCLVGLVVLLQLHLPAQLVALASLAPGRLDRIESYDRRLTDLRVA